ncbi:hypothetical protein LCGC14_1793590 [marine sediment metagenome]|uniref:Uncharacterized protein n=1 Tax=marine sediment metagenome TaxID=412755 RepID=A0A0F9JRC5_9ZZZZ
MRQEVRSDWALEYKFKRQVFAIIVEVFFEKIMHLDLKQGTDFCIVDPLSLAVRLRRYDFYKNFHHQFTMRWSRPSGVKTEYLKIMEGSVQWSFYGFLDAAERQIIDWCIMDLDVFRDIVKKYNLGPEEIRDNNPPDSKLAIYSKRSFPDEYFKAFWPEENYPYIKSGRVLDYSRVAKMRNLDRMLKTVIKQAK